MSYFILYLISISEGVQFLLSFGGMLLLFASLAIFLTLETKLLPIISLVFGILGIVLATLIPSKTDWYTILGGGALYEAATSEVAKDIGSDALDILKLKMLKEKEKLSKED